jgi:hypothetical protein
MIQQVNTQALQQPYPDLRARIIQRASLAEAYAFEKMTLRFGYFQCVISAPDLVYLAIRRRMSSGATPR